MCGYSSGTGDLNYCDSGYTNEYSKSCGNTSILKGSDDEYYTNEFTEE